MGDGVAVRPQSGARRVGSVTPRPMNASPAPYDALSGDYHPLGGGGGDIDGLQRPDHRRVPGQRREDHGPAEGFTLLLLHTKGSPVRSGAGDPGGLPAAGRGLGGLRHPRRRAQASGLVPQPRRPSGDDHRDRHRDDPGPGPGGHRRGAGADLGAAEGLLSPLRQVRGADLPGDPGRHPGTADRPAPRQPRRSSSVSSGGR